MPRKNTRFPLPFVLLLLVLLIAFGIIFGGSRAAKAVEIKEIPLNQVTDGIHRGQAALDPVKIEVEVVVNDHRLEDIKILKHENGLGGRAEEPVIAAMLEKQTNRVDVVTGASLSSKAIMKAVENALADQLK